MAKRVKAEVTGIVSILGSIYLALSLISYKKWDPSLFTYTKETAGNWGGIVGAYIADGLRGVFGVSAYAFPVFLLIYGIRRLISSEKHKIHAVGAGLFIVSVSLLTALLSDSFNISPGSSGFIGAWSGGTLKGLVSTIGAYIFSLALFFSSLIMLSPVSPIHYIAERRAQKRATGTSLEAPPDLEPQSEPLIFPEINTDESPVELTPLEPAEDILALEALESPQFGDAARFDEGRYSLPDIELLSSYETVAKQSKEELLTLTQLLEKKLADYGVQGKVSQVHTGPVVTMYEFEPAPGIKINRVVSLAEDLALALRAQSVRISPVSGKAAIGVEIPNRQRETCSIREIISSEGFKRSQSKLTLALGKDIFGNPVIADLTRMPHLLVAGATGAGKSVFLNSIVISILYKATPLEVKMLMIDPKLLELSAYDGIPHLISPVITNPKEAAEMLRRMVTEMERRYQIMADKGVRNIESFNAVSSGGERLPYIAILIDELADLMFASASQVEDSIARLAQMARASGIHLVVATQRPSVDVITGVIKANFPARISFQVTSKIDSRTVIDSQGAEQLIGRGDMLFMLPGVRLVRVHGALVTEEEIKAVVDSIAKQGAPDYSITERLVEEEPPDRDDSERDELYGNAIEFARAIGEVSISSLQRKFKVGYNRAARIMEIMEEDGLVGPPKGAGKPRDFLG